MRDEIQTKINYIRPLTNLLMTIGELPTSYLMSLTYEEQLLWFYNFLNEKIIPTVNNTSQAVQELQELFILLQKYVNEFFDNLDVQEEVNKKIDQMYEDGIFDEIFYKYSKVLNKYSSVKNREFDTDYYVTEIPYYNNIGVKNVWQIGLASDDIEGELEKTSKFAVRKNAKICINGGIFNESTGANIGLLIKDKIVLDNVPYYNNYNYEVLWFDENNDMYFAEANTTSASDLLALGCVNAIQGFARIVENGELTIEPLYPTTKEPRQIICQKEDNSYFIISTGGRDVYNSKGMTYTEAGTLAISLGAVKAYALDGGGSVTTCVNMVRQNEDIDSLGTKERKVRSFLYISDIETQDINVSLLAKEIQKLKQEYTEKLNYIANGLLKIQGTAGRVGIEFWENYANNRFGKLAINNSNFIVSMYDSTNEENIPILRVLPNGNLRLTGNKASLGVEFFDKEDTENRLGKMTVNDNHFIASMMIEGVNTPVILADENGISDSFSRLAHIYETGQIIEDLDEIDTEHGTTLYRVSTDSLNNPVTNSFGLLFRICYLKDNNIFDMYLDIPNNLILTRTYRTDTWSSWKQLNSSNYTP